MASISPLEWQGFVEDLFCQVELAELLRFIDFDRLIKGFDYPELGVNTRPVQFPRLGGLPKGVLFTRKIFGMQKGRAIIPHGHSNMTSAHLVLKGDLYLRHYDKLREEEHSLIIKPTEERTVSPGDYSTVSDEKDNVHWFIAASNTAFTFDVIMLDLEGKPYEIHNLDMDKQQSLQDGAMRVPVLGVEKALQKYGKTDHH